MNFAGRFFLVALLLGAAEVYLLVQVASALSFLGTLGLCMLTAMVGGALVRKQGLQTLRAIQVAMRHGEAPTVEIVAGLGLLVAGVLLIVPGFITDAIGFLTLVPPLRRNAASWLARRMEGRLAVASFPPFAQGARPRESSPRGRVIDIDPED